MINLLLHGFFAEHEERVLDNIGYYDEDLCVNVKNNENKTPIILMEPFSIETRTITKVMRERDDSDE